MGFSFSDLDPTYSKGAAGKAFGGVNDYLINPFYAASVDALEYVGEKIVDYFTPDIEFQDRQNTSQGPTTPRRVLYGQARVGGQLVWWESKGNDKEFLDVIYVLASHPCEEIGDIYIGDTLITDSKYDGLITVVRSTSGDGVINPTILANTGIDPTRYKYRGLTYLYCRFKYDQDAFQGPPSIQAIVTGKNDIYDPRTDSFGYTDNAALCSLDWVRNYLKVPDVRIEFDTWSEAANDCDVLVAAPNGGTEKRFTLNGSIKLSGTRLKSLTTLVVNTGVLVDNSQGMWSAVIQKYTAPVDDLTEHDVLSANVQIKTGASKQDKSNTIKGTYLDAENDYQQIEYTAIAPSEYITEDLEVLERTIDYPMVTSHGQCRRLSKLTLERSRKSFILTATFRRHTAWYKVGDRVTYTSERLGFDQKVFRVAGKNKDPLGGVELTLIADFPEIYDWEEGDALAVNVPPPLNLPDPDFIESPINLAVSESLYIANTTKAVKSRVTISFDGGDTTARNYEVEGSFEGGPYRVFTDYLTDNTYKIDDLEVGSWNFRARAVNVLNAKSAYTSQPFNVLGKTAPPADVENFKGTVKPFGIELSWDENPDLDIDRYEIRLGENWETATVLQSLQALKWSWETRPSGTEDLLIKAIDTSGNYSLNAAPASILIRQPNPVAPISAQVVDNFIFLQWADSTTSFSIDKYELRRGVEYSGATVLGTDKGTSITRFEVEAGTYTYWVTPYDIQGNIGTPSSITTTVDQPPDFVLQNNSNITLTSGDKTNIINVTGEAVTADDTLITADSTDYTADASAATALIGPVDTTETWAEHFEALRIASGYPMPVTADDDLITADSTTLTADNSYPSIQDLHIDQGYPYYIQPTPSNASYEEVIDLLGVIGLSRIQISPETEVVAGMPAVSYQIGYSLDGVSYTLADGLEASAKNFRYVKVIANITSPTGTDILRINSIRLRLDVKLKTDQGRFTTDASGKTTVFFNRDFVDIQSITVSPSGTGNLTAYYDFTDVPNPTSFDAYIRDDGVLVAGEGSWNVRGV